jgi:hypothetical protein
MYGMSGSCGKNIRVEEQRSIVKTFFVRAGE